MTSVIPTAFGFAAAAWVGMSLGRRLCAGRTPFADGPAPGRARPVLVLLVAGSVGAAAAMHGLATVPIAVVALVTAALAGCVIADWSCGIVPDALTLLPLGALIVAFAFRSDFGPLLAAVLVALPFALAATLSRGRGMGWGDVKLAALGRALLGAPAATLAFVLAALAAYAGSRFAGDRARPIAFAPYLAGGIAVVLIVGYGT
jgi:prepilin signal peptidase PulO-like enzyme (type II secretory pathway)